LSTSEARGYRGAVVWAFTTFQPEAPFDLVGTDEIERSYKTSREVAFAINKGELPDIPAFPVDAKIRPVVLLQDRPRGALPEYAALKLARFTKLSEQEQQAVRDGERPALFHLALNKSKYGLAQENAIDMNSLVRLHKSAIVTTKPVGYLDENEVNVLGRRLATFLDIDLAPVIRAGVEERFQALVDAQQQAKPSS
jgi:mRNA-degrading endonuclease toxin of MazEF toxin-antitoxin module